MHALQEKLTQLQENGWTLAALADELAVTVNAVEKWKAGDRYPSNAKLVLHVLDGLARRKRLPKQRRYTKMHEGARARNSSMPFSGADAIDPSMPLPLHVARLWGFPLQYPVVDGEAYCNMKDWLAGLTGSRQASHLWANYRARHKGDILPSREMPYITSHGRTYALDFTMDEGLYKITLLLRATRDRPVLKGRIYRFGDRAKPNKASKRPLTQASLRGTRWVTPSSLHRLPTPVQRCWRSHGQALATIPDPSGHPRALSLA